jgi:hypothetical protein
LPTSRPTTRTMKAEKMTMPTVSYMMRGRT